MTIPLHLILIGISFITSFAFIKKPAWTDRSMPVFLLMLFLLELYCHYLKIKHLGNHVQYNLWMPLEFSYYSLIIILSLKHTSIKFYLKLSVVVYFLFVLSYYLVFQDLSKFSGLTYFISMILLLSVSLTKMKELINSEEITNPFNEPFFWFITGLILVHVVGVFQFGATDYLHKNNLEVYRALQKINIFLSDVQYISLLIYFFKKWKYQK
jgi:hypothetical protein